MIENTPKIVNNYAVDTVRGAYENAARWMYYLVREGLEHGLPIEFAHDAMKASGDVFHTSRFQNVKSVEDFVREYMDFGAQKVKEGTVAQQDADHVKIVFGYCPLVAAWQKLTDDEEFIRKLCGCCEAMDRQIAEDLGMTLETEGTIAQGCGVCTLCFQKKD